MKKRIIKSTFIGASMMLCFSLTSCDSDNSIETKVEETTISNTNTNTSSVKETTTVSGTTTSTKVQETTSTLTTTTNLGNGSNEFIHKDNTLNLDSTLLTKNFSGDSTDKKITFHHTMNDSLQSILQYAIASFKNKYPDWDVESTLVGGYPDVYNSCSSALASGEQPDLAYCYPEHVADYLKTGKVVDISDYVNAMGTINGNQIGYTAEEQSDFIQGYYKEGLALNYADYNKYGYSGTDILSFPFVKTTEVLYYNEEELIEAGIVDNNGKAKAPTTWDELWADCEILKNKSPKCVPLSYDSEANWIVTMCAQNDWDYIQAKKPNYLFNNKNVENWFDFLSNQYNKKYFTTQKLYGKYTTGLLSIGLEYGGSAFYIGSSSGASRVDLNKKKIAVAPIPGSKLKDGTINNKSIFLGPSLVMFQSEKKNATERQLMTWEFVKCLEDAEFQTIFSLVSGYTPTRLSSFETAAYKSYIEDQTSIIPATAKVISTISNNYYYTPAFVGTSNARDAVQSAFLAVLRGEKTSDKALEEALNSCLSK